MHDLEIRGAGELLGARQHGHIAAVGFDLYTRLLAQSVQEARDRARQKMAFETASDGNGSGLRRGQRAGPAARIRWRPP